MDAFIKYPTPAQIKALLDSQKALSLPYPEVGCSRGGLSHARQVLPKGQYWMQSHNILLGEGGAVYQRAIEALRSWRFFDMPWLDIGNPDVPWQPGVDLAIMGRTVGVWWINPCRIIYTINEEQGSVYKFGFAYGTLPHNAVNGEERLLILWDRETDQVCYDLFSFSKPSQWFFKLTVLHLRHLQKRFAKESGRMMLHAISEADRH
ncbi:DUF1990 family protein [Magnetococcales bacterium HHB-1]